MLALLTGSLTRFRLRDAVPGVVTPERLVQVAFTSLALAAAIYLVRFGVNLPCQDEWDVVSSLIERQSLGEWALERHNEHRFVLGRAIWGVLMLGTGFDFRAGGWVTLALLTASALVVLRVAKQVRGRVAFADALVPALLLNVGHCFNFLMGYQVVFALVAVCGCALLAAALLARPGTETRTGGLAGLGTLAMAGNGGFGLGFAPPLIAWLLYLATRRLRDSRAGRWHALPLLALPLLTAGYVAWSVFHLPPCSAASPRPTLDSGFAVALGYLTAGLGAVLTDQAVVRSGLIPVIAACVALGYLVAIVRLAAVAWRTPDERPCAIGLLALLGGQCVVALGIGLTREVAITERYVTPSVVGLLACWATALRYGPRTPELAAIGTILGVLLAAGIAFANGSPSRHYAVLSLMRAPMVQFQADLRHGMPPTFLAGKYGHSYAMLIGDRLDPLLHRLGERKIGPFREAAEEPAWKLIAARGLALPHVMTPSAIDLAAADPFPDARRFDSPGRHVEGLQLGIEQSQRGGWQVFVLRWRDAAGEERRATAYGSFWANRGRIAFWVNDTPTDVRLELRGPGPGPTIHAAEWLTP